MHRTEFERHTLNPELRGLPATVLGARRGDSEAREQLLTALTWVAFSCPEATERVYDVVCKTWLHGEGEELQITESAMAPLGNDFWQAYWQVIDRAAHGYDAATITEAVASLGGAVDATFGELAEELAQRHSGADQPHKKPVPGMIDVEALGHCSRNSLGRELYDLLTINGYDAEVLDRNAIMLNDLPPALRYLNTRILQMHDVWHLVADYTTDSIHEVAISAFQLAQFGHNYSSMFLAVATRISHERHPEGFGILMQTIAEAWCHGRATPSFMAIDWEDLFDLSIDEIRETHGITPFESRVPEDLIETFDSGSIWRKLSMGLQVFWLNRDIKHLAG